MNSDISLMTKHYSFESDVTLESFTTEEKTLFADQYFINIGSLGRLWKKSIAMTLIRKVDAVAICEAGEKQNPAVWSDQGCRMYFRFAMRSLRYTISEESHYNI